ncbi:MAG: TIM barrel protein [Candidatus Bathyarchaeia archaeon]
MKPRFGPAGKPPWFKCAMVDVPAFLADEGLDAFEFQAVRMGMPDQVVGADRARALKENAQKNDVRLSLHAPYFVNLPSERAETRRKSVERLISSMRLASWMGAQQVVFHPGSYGKLFKENALRASIEAMREVIATAQEEGIKNVWLGPETTGKVTQLGDLGEIITMCEAVELSRPTVDFAHIHARGQGVIQAKRDYAEILEAIEERLGGEVVKNLHCHFTPVEFTQRGELRHHALGEGGYGPDFEPLAETIVELGFSPVIISESPLLDKDAITMRNIVLSKSQS